MDPQNEAQLIGRARRGENRAWEALIRRHQEPVFRLAYLLLGDPDDAEDVAQETFIRTHQHLARFDERRALRPWLLRITTNLARNRRRSLARYWGALERAARREPAAETVARDIDPEGAQALWQAVRRLKHTDQQVIYMRYFLELPEVEMATALDVPRGTVKSRLHRALGRLRNIIESEFPYLREGLRA